MASNEMTDCCRKKGVHLFFVSVNFQRTPVSGAEGSSNQEKAASKEKNLRAYYGIVKGGCPLKKSATKGGIAPTDAQNLGLTKVPGACCGDLDFVRGCLDGVLTPDGGYNDGLTRRTDRIPPP